MKTKAFIAASVAVLSAVYACDDKSSVEPVICPVPSYWSGPHTVMAGLSGKVHSVIEYTVEENLRFPMSYMVFNEKGNIISYDPTGLTVPESFITGDEAGLMSKARAETKAGFFSTSRYEFSYDTDGRLMTVSKYDMSETPSAVYEFTYGERGVNAILDITGTGISLVPGVVSVKCGYNGGEPDPQAQETFLFEVREDGSVHTRSASYSFGETSLRESDITYENGYPVKETAVRYSGSGENPEKTADETVEYEWETNNGSGILLSCVTDITGTDGSSTGTEDVYSSRFPMKKTLSRELRNGDIITETTYVYDQSGRLLESSYTAGHEGFASEQNIEYVASDSEGNWTESVQASQDGTYTVYREIEYFD